MALVRFYNTAVSAVAGTAMAAIVLVMGVQVFYRYALNDSLVWAEEVCRYLLILMTFLLIGRAFERGEMVSVQFLMALLPRRVAHTVSVAVYLLMIAFLVTIAYYGHQFATFNGRFSMPAVDFILRGIFGRPVSAGLSMYWLYMLIPLGCLMLSAHFAAALLRHLRAALGADETR